MSERTAAERHARVKEIFLGAVEIGDGERAAYLERECAGDVELRREVESLLGHHSEAPLLEERTVPQRPGAAAPVVAGAAGDPLELAGVTLDDRYKIERFVAEGGFGYVYRAEHLRWRRPVAIKVFKTVGTPEMQDALREAFVKEGALLNELSRKTTAIAQSYDVGSWKRASGPPLVFTVLEWLEGRSLADVIGKPPRPPWSLGQVIETLGPVADALAIAHASGVAHRDVKPRNIFLVEEKGAPAVKLLDFGAAKVAADLPGGFASTGAGLTVLTASYAAPEQYDKKYGATGPWTDVYALALVAVELLAGKHPLELTLTAGGGIPTPRRCGLEISDRVEDVFARALANEPAARFENAALFWKALVDAITAPPPAPPPVEKSSKLGLVIAVIAALTALAALAALFMR